MGGSSSGSLVESGPLPRADSHDAQHWKHVGLGCAARARRGTHSNAEGRWCIPRIPQRKVKASLGAGLVRRGLGA